MKDQTESGIRLGVFDLDGTLFSKSLPFLFAKWLFFTGHLPFRGLVKFLWIFFRYRFFFNRKEMFQKKISTLLESYFREKRLIALSHQFVSKTLPFLLNQKVFKYLKVLQRAKVKTLLLSSSPDFLVRIVAKKLKISMWKGVSYKKGSLILLDGFRKKEFVHKYLKSTGIEPDEVLAMADSLLDLPLLSSVGLPIVVNPEKSLLKISQERNWQVLS